MDSEYLAPDRAAWELEDPEGNPWVIQFAIDGIRSDALPAGEIVDFRVQPLIDEHGMPHGWAVIERDGAAVVAYALDLLPSLAGIPDFAIETGDAPCPAHESLYCGEERSVHVTAGGETATVPVRESREIGGITVYNSYFSDNRECGSVEPERRPQRRPLEFELGLYSAP
jgi:hypothetical protein